MGCLNHLQGGRTSVTTIAWATSALVCAALAGCSFVLDSSAKQCSTDSDCAHFDNHPFCRESVCVESGLGPPGCFFGTPTKQSDYLNQCTTSTNKVFDNCDRIGYCDGKQALPPMATPSTGKQGSALPPPAPTNLCTDGAPTDASGKPNMIWLYGAADFGPLLRAAQPALSAGPVPYRAVFQAVSSCQGVGAIYNKQSITDPPTETAGGWAFYYDANRNQVNCRLGPVGTPGFQVVDIGISDLFSQTCGFTPVAGVTPAEYSGPVVAFVLAAKAGSSQESISAEAAHLVFGNGGIAPQASGMKNAAPWTDYKKYFIRNSGAAATVLIAKMIGVDRAAFWGIDRVTTENLRDGLLSSTDTDAAIGTLSIDFYDKNRGNLKALYLQSTGQSAGYLPDSTPTTTDKINMRDGHYPLWGYVHFVVALDANGLPSPAANAMVLLFNVGKLDQQLVDSIIDASLVPECAMKVQRTSDLGDYTTRKEFSCGCYFDFKTRNGKTDCPTCKTADDCPGQSPCNYGFCEPGSPN
jgi:hypothetical protein